MPQKNVRLDSDLYDTLLEHKKKTGIPLAVAVNRAVKFWLEFIASNETLPSK